MYNLCVADDSINPGKYLVDGYPALHQFPTKHPGSSNEEKYSKDEL